MIDKKKVVAFVLSVVAICSLIGCGNKEDTKAEKPNDATVLSWLEAFKKTRNFNTRSDSVKINGVGNSFLVDNKLRFVQVWEIVKDSPNVSANVKEQVKKTLLLESIPIKP